MPVLIIPTAPERPPPRYSSPKDSVSANAIVGIVLGLIAYFAIMFAIFYYKRRLIKRLEASNPNIEAPQVRLRQRDIPVHSPELEGKPIPGNPPPTASPSVPDKPRAYRQPAASSSQNNPCYIDPNQGIFSRTYRNEAQQKVPRERKTVPLVPTSPTTAQQKSPSTRSGFCNYL